MIKEKMGAIKQSRIKAELDIWQLVNATKTLEELAIVIEFLADDHGLIQGRGDKHDAEEMAANCRKFTRPTALTREFGIRQQAFYISNK